MAEFGIEMVRPLPRSAGLALPLPSPTGAVASMPLTEAVALVRSDEASFPRTCPLEQFHPSHPHHSEQKGAVRDMQPGLTTPTKSP